jgi:hypothetical protein
MKDLVPEDWGLSPEIENAVIAQTSGADSLLSKTRKILYVVRVDEPLQNLAKFLKVKEEDLRVWNNMGINDNAVRGQTMVVNYTSDFK